MPEQRTLKSGLIIPAEAFAATIPAAAPIGEVATTADGRDITRGYVDALALLPPQDSVLMRRGAGDLRIYEEIRRDDQVKACFDQRRLAVVSREWTVEPGGPGRKARQAAESLDAQLDAIGWDAVTDKMLWGVFYGFAVAEALWVRDGAEIVLDDLRVRNRRRFGYAPDGSLRLKTQRTPDGEALPPSKFWMFSCGADNDDEPYGLGLGHWLYWPATFKRQGLKFWLMFLEKFGAPTSVGHYPPHAQPQEKTRLLQALQAITTDAGIIVPEGMSIELLEAARSGAADYQGLYQTMDAAIAKVTLGQTMTTDQGSSRSQAEVHMDVRQDLVKADADLVCESFNRTVARWLTYWNFGADCPVPKVWRQIEEPDDLDALASRDKTLTEIGYRPTLQRIQDTYGEGYEAKPLSRPRPVPVGLGDGEVPDEVADLPRRQAGDDAPLFAAGEIEASPVAALTERLADDATPALREWLAAVRTVVDQALAAGDSLEQLRDRLLDSFGALDTERLASVMELAFAAADLAGRVDVMDGSAG